MKLPYKKISNVLITGLEVKVEVGDPFWQSDIINGYFIDEVYIRDPMVGAKIQLYPFYIQEIAGYCQNDPGQAYT